MAQGCISFIKTSTFLTFFGALRVSFSLGSKNNVVSCGRKGRLARRAQRRRVQQRVGRKGRALAPDPLFIRLGL
jgi:hypothetical protein